MIQHDFPYLNPTTVNIWCCRTDNCKQINVDITEQLDEKFSVVESNAVVNPRTMMVHIQDATVADAAVMCSVRLPDIAHLAIPSSFCFVSHVESPIFWYEAWIRHDAFVKGKAKVEE